MGDMKKASDCICCSCKKKKAVAFWPVVDIDIPAHPYCKKCLNDAQIQLMIELSEIGFGELPKKSKQKT